MICIQEASLVLRVVTSAGSFASLGSVEAVLYNNLLHLHNYNSLSSLPPLYALML